MRWLGRAVGVEQQGIATPREEVRDPRIAVADTPGREAAACRYVEAGVQHVAVPRGLFAQVGAGRWQGQLHVHFADVGGEPAVRKAASRSMPLDLAPRPSPP